MSEIIKTENLQYAYPAEDGQLSVPVLKGVNLSIKRGEFVAVLGHNAVSYTHLLCTRHL